MSVQNLHKMLQTFINIPPRVRIYVLQKMTIGFLKRFRVFKEYIFYHLCNFPVHLPTNSIHVHIFVHTTYSILNFYSQITDRTPYVICSSQLYFLIFPSVFVPRKYETDPLSVQSYSYANVS